MTGQSEIARKIRWQGCCIREARDLAGKKPGSAVCQRQVLVFIDADTRIKEDYLETVRRSLESGVVGLTTAFEIEGSGLKTRIFEYICNCYLGINSKIDNVCLNGINLCVPRDVFYESWWLQGLCPRGRRFWPRAKKRGTDVFSDAKAGGDFTQATWSIWSGWDYADIISSLGWLMVERLNINIYLDI